MPTIDPQKPEWNKYSPVPSTIGRSIPPIEWNIYPPVPSTIDRSIPPIEWNRYPPVPSAVDRTIPTVDPQKPERDRHLEVSPTIDRTITTVEEMQLRSKLHRAIENERLEEVIGILKSKVSSKVWGQCESSGETALSLAVSKGRGDILLLLLDRGADINAVFHGKYRTALGAAVSYGDQRRDMVLLLLYRGADINMVGGPDGTALTAAVIRQSKDTISLLLDHSPGDINKIGCMYGTALGAAAATSPDMVSLLLARDADVNAMGGIYGTPLTTAVAAKRTDIVSLLLDWGADVGGIRGIYGTALAAAAATSTDIVSLLLDRGADINAVGGLYGTALATAAAAKRTDIVSLLLKKGADVNMKGGMCGTALATAVLAGETTTVSLLLDNGADINAVGGICGTALATAAFSGSTLSTDIVSPVVGRIGDMCKESFTKLDLGDEMSPLLNCFGEYINFENCIEKIAFTLAAGPGSTEIVSLLLDRGADTTLVGPKYETALVYYGSPSIPLLPGHTDIPLPLLERHADVMRVAGYPTTITVHSSRSGMAALPRSSRSAMVPPPRSSRSAISPFRSTRSAISPFRPGEAGYIRAQQKLIDRTHYKISTPQAPFPMPYTWQHYAQYAGWHSVLYAKGTEPLCLDDQFLVGASATITSRQADVPCQEVEEKDLCNFLAALVGLNKAAIQAKSQWIQSDIHHFVACKFDLGLAYAAARVAWKHFNEPSMDSDDYISSQRSQWHKHAQELDEVRSNAIEIDDGQKLITSPYTIMPRRLWDLKSNRVVNFRMLNTAPSTNISAPAFWAVSHSWTNDMPPIWTAINQYQWPVPCPKGINLDNLRAELLTFGAEYVWIDILCLRQKSGIECLERLKQEEWRLDVPTIGNIYRAASNIVRYFNGLGVPFSNTGWDDPRHWLQRAWTLQEIKTERTTINGGAQGQDVLYSRGEVSGKLITLRSAISPVRQLAKQLDRRHGCEVYKLAQEMAKRHASKPVDKISGLFYLLRTTKLLCYDETMTSEDFWKQSFQLLPAERKAEILFDYPYRGSSEQWFPTWEQMLQWPTRDPEYDHTQYQSSPALIRDIPGRISLIGNIWTIPHAVLQEADNPGQYIVTTHGRQFFFYLPYLSQNPINLRDQPTFTLAITEPEHDYNWVVCHEQHASNITPAVDEPHVLKKVGVLRTEECAALLAGGLLQKMNCLFV